MDFSAVLVPTISLLIAQITVMELSELRFHGKKLWMILGIELALQVALNGPLIAFLGVKIYAKWIFLTLDVPAIATYFYISKRRDFRDLFTILFTAFLSFSISLPILWYAHFHHGNYLMYNTVRVLVFAVVFIFIHFFVRDRYRMIQNEIEKGWGIFSIQPAIGTVMLYYQYSLYSRNKELEDILIICSVVIVFLAIIFGLFLYIFDQLHDKYLVQEQKRVLDLQNKAQRDQFEQQNIMAEKTNRRWHDLRHNNEVLIELIENGDTATAIAYLKEQHGMELVSKEEYCRHPSVNSILCLWAERSGKAGITVNIKTDVPEQLNIEPTELSSLFASVFENAYDGCLRLSEDKQKYIKVEAYYNGKCLAISVTNSCLEDILFQGDMPMSSKEGGGIGTRSIIYTVKRYNGISFFKAKAGKFTARFLLNI